MDKTTKSYIALVDDDESVCRSLGRLLRASGYQPIAYLSAEAFLADTNRPGFDCLVLDIQLEGISGIQLSQQLAASGCTTPVIFITAHDEPDVREQVRQIQGAVYLRKTEPAESVLAAIRGAIHSSVLQ